MPRYSVVISPPDNVIEQVRQLKQQLRSAISWYPSVNARAHITINEFDADADALLRWEAYIAGFAARQSPLSLAFDYTDAFPNGAFFLAPDTNSAHMLIPIMKAFHEQALLPARARSVTPHMSIGRRLTTDHLAIAGNLVQEVDIRFICHDLALRVFNEDRKQYDIYKRFPFGGAG